jgi:hypothetical protein
MHRLLGLLFAAALLLPPAGGAHAQAVTQIALTEKQVQAFIAAQPDLAALNEKYQDADPDKPDPKIAAEVEAAVKKHGFAGTAEYDDVTANILMVISGLDPETKAFVEAPDAIKQEIDAIRADKSIPAKDKKQMLDELNAALKDAQPLQHRGNIELVKKYYDQLAPLFAE